MVTEFVRICPQCNSSSVVVDQSNAALARVAGMTFACSRCGHKGLLFPEVDSKHIPDRKTPTRRTLVNTQYGSTVNWLWRVVGPCLLLLGLAFVSQSAILFLFYLGLLELLPFGVVVTLCGYSSRVRAHRWFRILFVVMLLYFSTTAVILPFYLAGL